MVEASLADGDYIEQEPKRRDVRCRGDASRLAAPSASGCDIAIEGVTTFQMRNQGTECVEGILFRGPYFLVVIGTDRRPTRMRF